MAHRPVVLEDPGQLDLAHALRETLGEELWVEVRALAVREEGTPAQALGKVLGKLAREALERVGLDDKAAAAPMTSTRC